MKLAKEAEGKKPYLATLIMDQKVHKCYNCAECQNVYPLKHLNKKKKVRLWIK